MTAEVRMLIDGELAEAASGRRFDNVNPATEDVLGQVADGSAADMDRAIAAARRAFDQMGWAGNRELRKRCLLQLQAALESECEELRDELVAEAGCPVTSIRAPYGPQLDTPLADALPWNAEMIDAFAWERELPTGSAMGVPS
jgi:aldehyde dehydrogenase (NAD+)